MGDTIGGYGREDRFWFNRPQTNMGAIRRASLEALKADFARHSMAGDGDMAC